MSGDPEQEKVSPDSIHQKKELPDPALFFLGKTLAEAEEGAGPFLAKNYREVGRGVNKPENGDPTFFIKLAYGSY